MVVRDFACKHIRAEVVRLLIHERKKRRLSMNVLAAEAGLSQSFVSTFESHSTNSNFDGMPPNPTLDSLLRMAEVLEVNLGDVLKKAIRNAGRKKARSVTAA